jgi:UDP-N-acetylglucosamine diphosphorylase / glucose-1-phosphate thymidylyltransferase / UDP-N-acetylgalactosamine diphosphorylase / glucosamine-1-phosphate N-acetyltransferase / galactosamine-1-phosphate N-acetyltransferase
MQVVILAAGRGKRMKHLTRVTTKSMLKIKGKPILEHKINALPKKIKEIIFVVGYQSGHILSHFKRYFAGRKIIYVFQTNINGTGGALSLAKSILKDKFLVMMGDDLYHRKDLEKILKHDLAILGYETDELNRLGAIQTDQRGYMVDIIEKPGNSKYKLVNTGVYVLNKKIFDYELAYIGNGEFGLPQTMARMARDHKIKVEKAQAWHPIGNQEDLRRAQKVLQNFI